MDIRMLLAALALCAGTATAFAAAPAQVIPLADIKPTCTEPFVFDETAGQCKPDTEALKKLDEAQCKGPGLAWAEGACTALADRQTHPAPQCGELLPDLAYNARTKACEVVRQTPRALLADFVGDCFKIVAALKPDRVNLPAGTHVEVLSQQPVGSNDKDLVVAPATPISLFGRTMGCGRTLGSAQHVSASALVEAGAHRYGWTYGVLTLPFKYYPGDKSIAPGGISLGPYVGRRWGSPGSAVTLAAAATLGSVKGEVRDANDKITSTPDLTAFSFALGLMWDISKNPSTKAFKIGLFTGLDNVGSNSDVKYKQNRKPWLAFQIGYDFTDN